MKSIIRRFSAAFMAFFLVLTMAPLPVLAEGEADRQVEPGHSYLVGVDIEDADYQLFGVTVASARIIADAGGDMSLTLFFKTDAYSGLSVTEWSIQEEGADAPSPCELTESVEEVGFRRMVTTSHKTTFPLSEIRAGQTLSGGFVLSDGSSGTWTLGFATDYWKDEGPTPGTDPEAEDPDPEEPSEAGEEEVYEDKLITEGAPSPFKYASGSDFGKPTQIEFNYDKMGGRSYVLYTVGEKSMIETLAPNQTAFGVTSDKVEWQEPQLIIDRPVIVKAIIRTRSEDGTSYTESEVAAVSYGYRGKFLDADSGKEAQDAIQSDDTVFENATITHKDGYDTIDLKTKSKLLYYGTVNVFTDAGERKLLSANRYYADMKQGETEQRIVWNGGIGGFIAPYDDAAGEGHFIVNVEAGQFQAGPAVLHIHEEGSKDIIVRLDLSKEGDILVSEERVASESAAEIQYTTLENMQPGMTYTGSFYTKRIDDENRESMLAGFFDREVRIDVQADGSANLTFYNTVYADSLMDFAIRSQSGDWGAAMAGGARIEELAGSRMVAAEYTVPVSDIETSGMVGSVLVRAMGGTEQMLGDYRLYTQVRLYFDETVAVGFEGFSTKKNRMTNDQLTNRALMTVGNKVTVDYTTEAGGRQVSRSEERFVSILDKDGDGYISDAELAAPDFPSELNLKREAMMSFYSLEDTGKMNDVSWLQKIGCKENVTRLDFNDLNITSVGDAFKGFTNLRELDLSANVISSIEDGAFSDLSGLRRIRLSSNMLTGIGADTFRGLTGLAGGSDQDSDSSASLDLSNNRISAIAPGAFDMMTGVRQFDLSNNVMTEFDAASIFQGNPQGVEVISLGYNRLTSVTGLSSLPNLRNLVLNHNRLYRLEEDFQGLTSLEKLSLIGNYISEIPDEFVTTNPNLKTLNVEKNSIVRAPAVLLKAAADKLPGFKSLYEYNAIDLSQCDLTSLSPEDQASVRAAAYERPNKIDYGVKVEARKGRISFQADLSALDYYIWALAKNSSSSYIRARVAQVLGEGRTVESVEDLRKFLKADLPSLDKAAVLASILTDENQVTDSVSLSTEIQKLAGDEWVPVMVWKDEQDASTTGGTRSGEYFDENAEEGSQYRLLFSCRSGMTDMRSHDFVFYFINEGDAELPAPTPEAEKPPSVTPAPQPTPAPQDMPSPDQDGRTGDYKRMLAEEYRLPDGKYTVDIKMLKTSGDLPSMADASVTHKILIDVREGIPYVNAGFSGMTVSGPDKKDLLGYLGRLSYYKKGYEYKAGSRVPKGKYEAARVLSEHRDAAGEILRDSYNAAGEAYPHEVEFPIVNLKRAYREGILPLHVYVPIMDAIYKGTGDQDVIMQFDWSTLTQVDDKTKLADLVQKKNEDRVVSAPASSDRPSGGITKKPVPANQGKSASGSQDQGGGKGDQDQGVLRTTVGNSGGGGGQGSITRTKTGSAGSGSRPLQSQKVNSADKAKSGDKKAADSKKEDGKKTLRQARTPLDQRTGKTAGGAGVKKDGDKSLGSLVKESEGDLSAGEEKGADRDYSSALLGPVRSGLIAGLILGIGGGAYWYFIRRKKPLIPAGDDDEFDPDGY